jgi:hypothetical protein
MLVLPDRFVSAFWSIGLRQDAFEMSVTSGGRSIFYEVNA